MQYISRVNVGFYLSNKGVIVIVIMSVIVFIFMLVSNDVVFFKKVQYGKFGQVMIQLIRVRFIQIKVRGYDFVGNDFILKGIIKFDIFEGFFVLEGILQEVWD